MCTHEKHLTTLIALVLIGLNFYFLLSLKEDMEQLRMRIADLRSSVDSYSSMVHSTVLNAVEEGNSIIEFFNYDFKNFDKDKKTIDFNYKITPKEYSTNSNAYLYIDGIEEEMILQGSDFILDKNIPINQEFTIGNFSLVDGETTKIQKFNQKISPLKELTFRLSGLPAGYSYSSDDEGGKFEILKEKIDFVIDYNHLIEKEKDIEDLYKPKTASLILYIDDKVIETKNYEIMYKSENDETVDKIQGFDCFINIDEFKFEAPAGIKVEVNFEVKDEFGFTHVMNLIKKTIAKDGSLQHQEDFPQKYIKADGKIIYYYDLDY